MKTDEWLEAIDKNPDFNDFRYDREKLRKLICEIQLDASLSAYERGIRDAAEVARKTYAGWEWNFMYQDASQTIGNEIESLLTKPKDKE